VLCLQRAFGAFATPNERYLVNTHALTLENLDAITGPVRPRRSCGPYERSCRKELCSTSHSSFVLRPRRRFR
jgi:hypothetical protein